MGTSLDIKTNLKITPYKGEIPKVGELPSGHFFCCWRRHDENGFQEVSTKSYKSIKEAVARWNIWMQTINQ